jgi:F-type H+-transporting ATPase subunit a
MWRRYLLILGVIFAIEVVIAWHIQPDLTKIAEPIEKWNSIFGIPIPKQLNGINKTTVTMTWAVMFLLAGGSYLVTRKLADIPGKAQAALEYFVGGMQSLCVQTLGPRGKRFTPFIGTIFIFVLASNWLAIIPTPWGISPSVRHFLRIPEWLNIEEPTRDLNTTLGLGIICFFTAHICGIRFSGLKKYMSEYFEPMLVIKGKKIPNVPMLFLNLVGECGKLISHSFRLFGNIMGGAVIFIVGTGIIFKFIKPTLFGYLCSPAIILPLGLNVFFGLFVGLVQAFVFAMLALTYISVLIAE